MNIIVLGNGPSVLQNKYGHIIDEFDEVVRINHYKPDMKEHVGEKVTIYCTSAYKPQYYKKICDVAKEILIWCEIRTGGTCYNNHPCAKIITRDSGVKPDKFISKIPIEKKLREFGFNDFPSAPWVSTGIGILMYLIQTGKYKKICIYGFDGLENGKQIHYFSGHIKKNQKEHSTELERKFIKHYIDKGILYRLEDSQYVNSRKIIVNSTDHISGLKGAYFNFRNKNNLEDGKIYKVYNKNKIKMKIIIWTRLNGSHDHTSDAHGRYVHNFKAGDFNVGDEMIIIE